MNLEKGGRKLPQSPAGPDTPPSSLSCDSEHIFHTALLNSFPGLSTVCFLPALSTNFVVAPRHFCPVIRHNVSLPVVVWALEDQEQKVGVQAYKSWHFKPSFGPIPRKTTSAQRNVFQLLFGHG